jgi:hypothetical protein
MPTPTDQIVSQMDDMIRLYKPSIEVRSGQQYIGGPDWYQQEAQSRLNATIHRFTLPGDAYRAELDRIHEQKRTAAWRAVQMLGLLTALRDDYAAGNMATVQELIHSDLFSDFLEMADELQGKGYKDPAAVLTGSVLEEHLRKLGDQCQHSHHRCRRDSPESGCHQRRVGESGLRQERAEASNGLARITQQRGAWSIRRL